jgi:hypothetical protein
MTDNLPLPIRILNACHAAGIPLFDVIAFHTGLVAPPGKVTLPPGTEASYQEGLDVRTGMLEEQARS